MAKSSQSKLFEGLKAGLEDIIAYKKGRLKLTSEEFEIPKSQLPTKPKKKSLNGNSQAPFLNN